MGTKSLLFEWFLGQTATIGTNIVSAVVAVIVLHLALGLFIYKAYFDDGKKSIKSDRGALPSSDYFFQKLVICEVYFAPHSDEGILRGLLAFCLCSQRANVGLLSLCL